MSGNFFDDLFDSLTGSWNRSFKEKDGYTIMEAKDHNGFLIVFNTLGVSEKDIKVTHSKVSQTRYGFREDPNNNNNTYIRVAGNTKIPEMNDQLFSVNYEVVFRNPNPVDNIQYMVKDGLTIVYVKTKEPESHSTDAENIKNGGSFNW